MFYLKLTAVPSAISPVLVTFPPPSGVASRTSVWLLIGLAAVVLDLAALNFQVPAELSAPNIPMAVIATPIAIFAPMLRIVFLSFPTLTSPRKLSGVQRRPDGPHRWWETQPSGRSPQQPSPQSAGVKYITSAGRRYPQNCSADLFLSRQSRKFRSGKVESSGFRPRAKAQAAIPSSLSVFPRTAAGSRQGRAGVARRRAALTGGRDARRCSLREWQGNDKRYLHPLIV